MAQIGTITIPESDTSLVFPLSLEYPLVTTITPTVASHQFNSGDRKITQRFLIGANTRRFTLNFAFLPKSRYGQLTDFFATLKGPYSTFLMNDPESGSQIRVRLADENLSLQLVTDAVATGLSLTLVEVPTTTPSYTVSSTVNRFPSTALNSALTGQAQEIIPLIKIVPQTGCPAIYLSDRKVTVSGTTYEPRLLDWSGIGQSADGSADQAGFVFGNADRVFSDLTKTINILKARIEFSLFHVTTTIKLDLWAGDITDWQFDAGNEFRVQAADGLWELRQSYPARKYSRTCWKTPQGEAPGNCSGCPFAGTCERTWDTCGAKDSFGGVIANPETVYLGGWAKAQKDNSFTSKSIVDDNLYGKVVPEVYMDYMQSKKLVNGVEQYQQAEMPVDCQVASIRDENEFLTGLGVIGEGEITEFGTGHTLNGAVHHGVGTSHPNYGLRLGYGYDPVPANSSDGFAQFFNLSDTSNTYTSGRSAGTSFIELRTVDEAGKQLKAITEYVMKAYIRLGIKGWMWNGPGSRYKGTLSNPVWIAVNMVLKAKGVQLADVATQEGYFDVNQAVADAAFCDQYITKVVAGGNTTTRKRYQFRGIIKDEKALKDWLTEVLNTCLGGYTFAFGKMRTFLRANSGSVSAFTDGNVIADSLQVAPLNPAFNQLSIQFGNLELEGINDAVTIAAHEHARMVGSTIAPKYTKADINLAGIASRDEAAVWSATRLKEELGGATQAEWVAARKLSFKTTILALETTPGMVCSLNVSDLPVNEPANGTHEFRILNWRLNKDYSIDIEGRSCTDAVYDMLQGPNPADIESPALPEWDQSGIIPPDVTDVSTLAAIDEDLRAVVPVKFKVPTAYGTLAAIKAYVRIPDDATQAKDAGRHNIDFSGLDASGYYTINVDVNKPTDAAKNVIIYLVSCSNVYEKALDFTNTPHTASIPITKATIAGSGLAPNITTATATPDYHFYGNVSAFGFTGRITLPTTDPSYSHLAKVSVVAYTGSVDQGVEICSFTSPFTGDYIDYNAGDFQQKTDANETWGVEFVCYDELNTVTLDPFTVENITVSKSGITSISAVDASTLQTNDPNYHARWQDPALHIVVNATVSCNQYPKIVTLWTNNGTKSLWHGWFKIAANNTVIPIGLKDDPNKTALFAPDNDETWTVVCAPGTVMAEDPIPAEALMSASFPVRSANAPSTTAASGAYIDEITYIQVGGGAYDFGWKHLYVTLPLDDPEFWFARITLQTGKIADGVFTPGGAHPEETNMCDWSTDTDHGQNMTRVSGTNTIYDANPNTWGVPSDGNTCHRFRIYVASRRGGPEGTKVLQQCWSSVLGAPGGTADHYDLIVDGTKAYIDATLLNPDTYDTTTFGVKDGKFVQIAIDLGLPKPGTYDASVFAPIDGKLTQIAVDMGLPKPGTFDATMFQSVNNIFKANLSSQFKTSNGNIEIDSIDCNVLKAGNVKVGNAAGMPTSVSVYKDGTTLVGWLGHNGSIVGIWAKEAYFGGTSPADAKIKCDASGNAYFSGTIAVGQVTGLGSLATQSSVTTGQVSGLGTLATQNYVTTGQVSGLGALATQSVVNASTQVSGLGSLAFQSAVSAGQVSGLGPFATVTTISGNSITTGSIYLGNGANMPTGLYVYRNGGAQLTGWVGVNGSYVGAWFQEAYFGGSSPMDAKIKCDINGNATFSGALVGGSLDIITSTGRVTINSSTLGVHVDNYNSQCSGFSTAMAGGYSVNVYPYSVLINTPSGNSSWQYNGLGFTYGSSQWANYGVSGLSIVYSNQNSSLTYSELAFGQNGQYPVRLGPSGLTMTGGIVIAKDFVYADQSMIQNPTVKRYGTGDVPQPGWYLRVTIGGGVWYLPLYQ